MHDTLHACEANQLSIQNFRHHTVSASRNHGAALATNSSGDIILLGSR